jgi:O-antigen/teichoic acid export membrane protein
LSISVRFIKDSSLYLIANIINAAIPFLLLPFLTKALSPADYGLLAMFQVLSTAIMPFISLNLDSSLARYYFEFDEVRMKSLIANGIFITFITSIITAVVFLIFAQQLSALSDFPYTWLWTLVMFSIFQKIFEIPLALWRVQHKALRYGIFRILKTFFEIGLSVVVILLVEATWKGRVEAQLIAAVFFGVYALYYLLRMTNWTISLNRNDITTLVKYGLPLIPHELGAFIIAYSDRLFIMNMVGPEATGLYSVGYQIGLVIGLLQNSFNQAWVPWFFETLTQGRTRDKVNIVKITYVYFLGILILVFGLIFTLPLIFSFLGKDFAMASQFVFWIALGFAFNGMYKMVVNYLFYVKRTYVVGSITFLTAILNIVLNYFFITHYGAIGSAYATVIAFFIQFVVTWIISIQVYEMPWFINLKR